MQSDFVPLHERPLSVEALVPERVVKRVGHRGAARLAPGNSLASFDAALEAGVDMIEFDVRSRRGELVVAHQIWDVWQGAWISLRDVLSHLSNPQFNSLEFNIDVKQPGYEHGLLKMLEDYGLLERCLISSQFSKSLDRIKRVYPQARVGISVGNYWGRVRHRHRRRGLQSWVESELADGRWSALMLHHRLVTKELVEKTQLLGAEIYAWTADDSKLINRLTALQVNGITSNDPRLFVQKTA